MSTPLADELRGEMDCVASVARVHGLGRFEETCFRVLLESDEPLTVDEIADRTARERSTSYRTIQRLRERGLVGRTAVNHEHGGYYHVYRPADPSRIACDARLLLDERYATVERLVDALEEGDAAVAWKSVAGAE